MLATLHIDTTGIPIYVQIRDQILAAIGSGSLVPGERLPTMREVAVALKIDLNTVRHAYEAAQDTGAIVLVKSRGSFVAEQPAPAEPATLTARVDVMAQQTIAVARAGGIDPALLAHRIIDLLQGTPS